jgi:hypothetical protein
VFLDWIGRKAVVAYGKMSAAEIINRRNRLRRAIRSEGSPKIQEAWDAYEEVLDFDLMSHRGGSSGIDDSN